MKVAVIGTRGFPGVQGGVEKHCEKLYTYLAKKECNITVFTRKRYVLPSLQSYEGVSLKSVDCPGSKYMEAIIHSFKCIFEARKLKPDILHIHAIGPSLFAPLARLLGMRVVVTNHGPDYNRGKWSVPAKYFLKFSEWMGARFANEIIAIADNIADDIKLKFKRSAFVIPNGVELPEMQDSDDILNTIKLNHQRYILAIGRFVPEKGFDDLIEAFNRLIEANSKTDEIKTEGSEINKHKNEEWKLVIVGDADHEDQYSKELKRKALLNNRIVLTGFLTGQPLHEIYMNAGLFVIPSHHEGLPIVLLEAMSYGLSCIASDIPANKNVEIDQNRFFETGNVDSLIRKIEVFMNKPWKEEDKRKQLDTIVKKYNWEKIADDTLNVYRHAVS